MEKGLRYLVFLVLALFILLFSTNVQAYDCINGYSDTECVCGYIPDSSEGYGQVIIGATVYSCNNIGDGICPEDFTDGVTPGNCSSCADFDCSSGSTPLGIEGYVYGYVHDKLGAPIAQATVTGNPNQWDPNANLKITATTNAAGYYISSSFLTGTYYFSASKDGYDTDLQEATVTRGLNTQVDFVLQDGTCYSDCTNSQNRCSAACDGVTFADGSSCHFYNGSGIVPLANPYEVKLLCNNREKGTRMKLSTGATASEAYFVECCDKIPEIFYYTKAEVKPPEDCDNLITQEKIARYNDVAVRVVTKYCGD
jgi:hypothetical protein